MVRDHRSHRTDAEARGSLVTTLSEDNINQERKGRPTSYGQRGPDGNSTATRTGTAKGPTRGAQKLSVSARNRWNLEMP